MEAGGKLDPEVIGRHKKAHYIAPVDPEAPKPTKRDLALMLRDKVADAVEGMSGEALVFMGKDLAPMVGKGLQAQVVLDKREVNDRKLGLAAGALGFQMFLAGLGRTEDPPELLDDPKVVEGVFDEVD